jgi:hypothetical protein
MNPRIRNLFVIGLALAFLAACGTEAPPVTPTAQLTVTVAGEGSGVVTSSPGGINTGATPPETTAAFPEGQVVTLTAAPIGDSTFAGFSVEGDAECEDADPTDMVCVLTMDAARSVTATFDAAVDPGPFPLTVAINTVGESAGTVTSNPPGIDCPDGDCTADFEGGTSVVLTATATEGFFTGWTGGDCAGVTALTCTVTVGPSEPTVTANFGETDEPLPGTATSRIAARAGSGAELLQASSSNATNFPVGFSWWNSSDIDIGYDTSHAPNAISLLFANLDVPAGATIDSAVVTFTALSGAQGSADVPLTVTAQDAASPAAPVQDGATQASFDVTGRTRVGASVPWNLTTAWAADQTYDTPNLASVLQAVVNRTDWEAGSDVLIIIEPTGTVTNTQYRRANPEGAATGPLLTVEYSTTP